MKKDYTEQAWYTGITDEDKKKLEELRQAQARQNNNLALTVQRSKDSDMSVLAICVAWVGHKLNAGYPNHKSIIHQHLLPAQTALDNSNQIYHFNLLSTGEVFNQHEKAELICQNEGTQFVLFDDKQESTILEPKKPEYVYFPSDYTLLTPISRPGNAGLHWIQQADIEVLLQFVEDLKNKGQIFIAMPHDLESIQKFKTFLGTEWNDSMIFDSLNALQSGISLENRQTFEYEF